MYQGTILDETSAQIGVFLFDTFPYGDTEEERQGTVWTSATPVDLSTPRDEIEWVIDESRPITESITICHTILWRDARNYPNEVALISSYPGDYYEIGKRINGTWISAGIICDFSARNDWCNEDERKAGGRYSIQWGKAFEHLPTCTVFLPTMQKVE